MTDENLIDSARSRCLCEIGCTYIAATAVDTDGNEHLVLAHRNSLGDPTIRYDADCSDVMHEQLGQLPLEYVRRLTVSQRRQRNGDSG